MLRIPPSRRAGGPGHHFPVVAASECLGSGHFPELANRPTRSPRWRQHRASDPATSLNWRTDHHFAEVAVTECPASSHFAEPAEPATTTPKWWQRSAPDLATSPNWQTPPPVPRDGAAECSGCSQLPNSRAGRHFPDVAATTCPGSSHFAELANRATTSAKWWQRTAPESSHPPELAGRAGHHTARIRAGRRESPRRPRQSRTVEPGPPTPTAPVGRNVTWRTSGP